MTDNIGDFHIITLLDRRQLRIRLLKALCSKDADARSNNRPITTFALDNDLCGGFDADYVKKELPLFERQIGFIRLFDNGHIALAAEGRHHCNNPDESL